MAARGHDVLVATGGPRVGGGRGQGTEPQAGGQVRRVLSNIQWGPPFPPESLSGLLRAEAADRAAVAGAIRDHRPDVIDIWGMEFASQALAGSLAAGPVPVHFTLEDVWLCNTWRSDPLLMVGQVARALGVALPAEIALLVGPGVVMPDTSFAAVTFVSSALAERYTEAGFRHSSSRIRLAGIDLSRFAACEPPTRPPFVLLNVGRLTESRGQADIVAALAALRRQKVDLDPLVLMLAGQADAEVAERLRSMAAGIPGLTLELRGPVEPPRMPEVYQAGHLFVQSSRLPEGLPIALVEAMASGLPVIATDTGGQRDILDGGRWGRLIPARRPDLMAVAVSEVIDDFGKCRELAAAAREYVRRTFDIEAYVEGHLDDLCEAASRRAQTRKNTHLPLPHDAAIVAFQANLRSAAGAAAVGTDVAQDADAAWRLGSVLKRCGAVAEARGVFERLAGLSSARAEDVRRSAFHLGELAMIESRWGAAEANLRACLDLVPDHRKAVYDLECVRQRRLPEHLQGLEP